ncbi:MAG: hypothetical protein AB7D06_04580 [Pedobacter sp.]
MNVSSHGFKDATEASLASMTERELADWLILRGEKIIRHKGRYWWARYPGFYVATHHMARMSLDEATCPNALCWGFRTSLHPADAGKANGSMPLHLLTDVSGYTLQTLSGRCRNKLRKLRTQVRIVALQEPGLLLDQGYDILCSAHARNRYGRVPTRSGYRDQIRRYFESKKALVIGGMVDGKLGGYLTSYAVGATAYVDDLFLHSQYLKTNISLGLFFDWVQVCRRSGSISEIVHGLHAREAPGLCQYKEELGLSIVRIPTRIWFAPLADKIVKRLHPHAYYRLTGHD